WNLPVINAIAAAAVIAGVAYRIWEANLPATVLRQEAVLIALGVVLAAVAVAVRISKLATSLVAQLAIMAGAATLAVLVLGVARQSSLLATLSDLGEGLLITEGGRFVAGNDAYVKLTGYTRAELESMQSLIDLAPEEEREQLAANLAKRLSGGDVPARYTSAVITKSGRRIQ